MRRDGQAIEAIFARLRRSAGHKGAGDEEAGYEEDCRALFDHFYGPLCRFFEHRGFAAAQCQDLVQETMLRVYRGIAGFRGESRCEHWVFRIAANTAIKALRHQGASKRAGREVSLAPDLEGEGTEISLAPLAAADPDGVAEPLRRLLSKEARQHLLRAIEGLPAQMRRCVRLRVLQSLEYEEIAELLQLSPSTVKVQLFKARRRLEQELGKMIPGLGP